MEPTHQFWIWFPPAFAALVTWGVAQGLVKKYIEEASPARFCLFFIVAKSFVSLGYFFSTEHPPPFSEEGRSFLYFGLFAYLLDGIGWILYYKSIVYGPISIVGTLSAAYPALTVLFARIFLSEILSSLQYAAVALVIVGCLGLAYEPKSERGSARKRHLIWTVYAGGALLIWGAAQTLVKYAYSLPGADESNLSLFSVLSGYLTLGVYGLLAGGLNNTTVHLWKISFFPMVVMAFGDLLVIIATRLGPVSLVSPITGAYPVVTLLFAWFVLKERISKLQWVSLGIILVGLFLSPGEG